MVVGSSWQRCGWRAVGEDDQRVLLDEVASDGSGGSQDVDDEGGTEMESELWMYMTRGSCFNAYACPRDHTTDAIVKCEL